jgi:hypothetical protein
MVDVEKITCDNPECVAYVEELIRQEPGSYELVEFVRSQLAPTDGHTWRDFDECPAHSVRSQRRECGSGLRTALGVLVDRCMFEVLLEEPAYETRAGGLRQNSELHRWMRSRCRPRR